MELYFLAMVRNEPNNVLSVIIYNLFPLLYKLLNPFVENQMTPNRENKGGWGSFSQLSVSIASLVILSAWGWASSFRRMIPWCRFFAWLHLFVAFVELKEPLSSLGGLSELAILCTAPYWSTGTKTTAAQRIKMAQQCSCMLWANPLTILPKEQFFGDCVFSSYKGGAESSWLQF